MTGTDAALRRPELYGEEYLPAATALTASNAWEPVGLQVTLPEAGVWEVTGEAHGVVNFIAPPGPATANAALAYRLFNVTAGAAVPRSQRIAFLFTGDPEVQRGHHGSPTLHAFIQATGPTVIRMDHFRYVSPAGGTFGVSETRGGDGLGETVLRYRRMDV